MKRPIYLLAWTMIIPGLTASQSRAQSAYEAYTFTTLAGNAGYGIDDGTGSAARFGSPDSGPVGVAVDSAGNIFVADTGNHTIRKVTPDGVVTTLAGLAGSPGSTDGRGSAARFSRPSGVAVDKAGNVYVADSLNNTIRKMTPAGVVTTLAGAALVNGSFDGTGSAAFFYSPRGVAVDSTGNVYVADTGNNTIRKVTPTGVVTTLAGLAGNHGSADGTGSDARFLGPTGVAVDNASNVYVADSLNSTIRKVAPLGTNWVVTTLAGLALNPGSTDGTRSAARFGSPIYPFDGPYGVAVDSAGNVYVADEGNHTIRKVTPAGAVTTLAGLAGSSGSADAEGPAAQFFSPQGVAVDSTDNIYVADTANNTIRKVTPARVVTTLAGLAGGSGNVDATGSAARFNSPAGVAVDSVGNVYAADTLNCTIRKVTPAGVVTTLAGLAGSPGSTDGAGSDARFNRPNGLATDDAGNVYVADTYNNTIRKVTPAGLVTTLAGLAGDGHCCPDGTGSAARFAAPSGVAVDGAGNVYVADAASHTIRKVTPPGVVTTLAGLVGSPGSADGTRSAARFYFPYSVAVDSAGNVYVADSTSRTIRKVTPAGVVTTLTGRPQVDGSTDGTGRAALFRYTTGVAVDGAGNVYAADPFNNAIRKVTPAGVVTTLAGWGQGSADGTGSDARFWHPSGVAVDSSGNVYVADSNNQTIRKGYSAPSGFVLFGSRWGLDGGKFGFFLIGPTRQSVVVEASTDFLSWLPVWTNTFAGALIFSDRQSGVYSNRFYRAYLP